MCGIAGVVAAAGHEQPEALPGRLAAMADAVAHRGPDDRGTWHDGHAGLAATRLAIVDLSAAGRQPMLRDGAVVAFNGEIYNFRELRRGLVAAGHRFSSGTDTEVILAGYAAWGDDVVVRLRGMFALALWDSSRRRLLLARDRLGQKPLYYAWHEGSLLFGSEVKALAAWPGFHRRPDLEAVHRYLTFRYVPGPATAFAGVCRLPPGHTMSVDAGGARLRRYWYRPRPAAGVHATRRDLAAEVRERLDEAVRLRMAADVPVGAFLSGGIDSSSVVAAMAAAAPGPVRTFTVGFDDAALDERRHARLVAERYGTIHREVAATVDLCRIVPRLVWHYGEPFADPVAIATYLLAAAARRDVKVVLTGDGGDEAFLGYRRHAASRVAGWLDHAPASLRSAVAAAARRRLGAGHARRFLGSLDRRPAQRYATWVSYLAPDLAGELYGGDLAGYAAQRAGDLVRPWFAASGSPAWQAAEADLDTFLPDELLVRLDVATMAHGLEARSPFLDHELVEFALALPVGTRMPWLRNKGLLRQAMSARLPPSLRRRPKLGFAMPLGLRRPAAATLVRETLAPDAVRARGLFAPAAVATLLDRYYGDGEPREQEVWTLFMLEQWFRMWIDPPTPPAGPLIRAG